MSIQNYLLIGFVLLFIVLFIFTVIGLVMSDSTESQMVRSKEIQENEIIPQKQIDIPDGCYDVITKRKSGVQLFMSKYPLEEGKNPLIFKDLVEYKEWVESRLRKMIQCPILNLNEENQFYHQEEKSSELEYSLETKKVRAGLGRKSRKWDKWNWNKPWVPTPINSLNDYEQNIYFGNKDDENDDKQKRDDRENEYIEKTQWDVSKYVGVDGVVEGEPNVHLQKESLIEKSRREAAGEYADDPTPVVSSKNIRELPEKKIRESVEANDPMQKGAKMMRTGINQYQITEIVPEREGDLPYDEEEEKVEKKLETDLRQQGGVVSLGGVMGAGRLFQSQT